MTFSDASASQAPVDSHAISLVVGASGGVGAALVSALQARGETVWAWSRAGDPPVDITDEASVRAAAALLQAQLLADGRTLRRVWVATGVLHGQTPDGGAMAPERSWRDIRPEALLRQFEVNALGPMLLLKHLLPLLPKRAPSWVACLSARVGSVGDNRLGGWYSYRASKAALNQLVHTAAIELARSHPQACCVALHPGTVDTGLSQPFAKTGLQVRPPAVAAQELLAVLDALTPAHSGGFFDHHGEPVPW
jgi:NAD(P)-dependent dehydrogenase (short-subunit alcohol dehydrogenase family)